MRVQGAKSVEGDICPNFHLYLYIFLEKLLVWVLNQGTSTEEREQLAVLCF